MKHRATLIAATFLMVLILAPMSYAGPGCCGGGPGPGGSYLGIWNVLTKDQQKQVESLRLEFFKKMETLQGQLGRKRVELMELASKDSPNEDAIQKKREEIWSLRDTMRKEGRTLATKIRSLLTPEQKKKIGPYGGGFFPRGGHGPAGCFFGGGSGFRGGCPWSSWGSNT